MKNTRIDRVRAALKKHGPMTALQISEITGIKLKNVGGLISVYRKSPGRKMRIRKAGKTREGNTTLSFIFELSNEPDAVIVPPTPKRAIPRPRALHDEMTDQKRIAFLAAQSVPFRDPMIFFTAGRAP